MSGRTEQAFTPSREEHREPFSCSGPKAGACLEGKEPSPALRGEVPSHPLARGRVRSRLGGQSPSPSPSLQQRQGRHPFLAAPPWVTGRDHNLLFSSPSGSCWIFGSWLLRRCGCKQFLCLELAAEPRDQREQPATALHHLFSSEEQLVWGAGWHKPCLPAGFWFWWWVSRSFILAASWTVMRHWCATNHGGILLPPKAASHWVTVGQYFSPKPPPSTASLVQGELWVERLFPLSICHPIPCIF